MNIKYNLSTKKLNEFVSGDTIYCRYNKSDQKPLFLCEFISYDYKKALVTARILEHFEWNKGYKQDEIITVRYSDCALYGNATDEENRAYYRFFDSSLYAMHPLEEHKVFGNDVHVEKHPSYGMARFSRINGYNRSLFGSSVQSQNSITFTISRAKHERSHANDWFHSCEELIEIEMSNNQFAELITSFNYGSGIPVTICHVNHDRYPYPPFQSKFDLHNAEFKKQMFNYGIDAQKMVEKTLDLLNKNTIGKTDREVIRKEIESLMNMIKSSIPFYQEQFVEATEKTLVEAKSEFEAWVEGQIRSKGLQALADEIKSQMPLIENPIKD